jgi:adenine-specific DNA-methyltransferase
MNNLHVINQKKESAYHIKYLLALINSSLQNFYYQYLNPEVGEALAEVKKENVEKLLIKPSNRENSFVAIVDYILFIKPLKQSVSNFFERLLDTMVYELYLPDSIGASSADVLQHLDNFPQLQNGEDQKNLILIEKIYEELSSSFHPVSSALHKLINVEDVAIIEGRK